MSLREQIVDVENRLMEANRKARHANEALETAGVKDFIGWVDLTTTPRYPNITGLDSLIAYTVQNLFNAGVRYAGTYFQMAQNDPEILKNHLEGLKAEAAELDIVDDENVV